MKKTFILFALLSFVIGNISAQDLSPNRRLKSGVWLKLGYDATFSNFLTQKGITVSGDKVSDYGVNFQFGSTFYIGPRIANKLRFGLDAAWIDFSYFQFNQNFWDNGMGFFFNFLEVGPKISFSPVSSIAFDLYGRIVPSFSLLIGNQSVQNTTYNYVYNGFNASGIMGASFRYKVFMAGVEYNFGKMTYNVTTEDSNPYQIDKTPKIITNNLRVYIGFKF